MRSMPLILGAASLACLGIGSACKDNGKSGGSSEPGDDDAAKAPIREIAPPANTNVNAFLANGPPTFVRGTAGDRRSDRIITAQIGLVRNLVAPSSAMLDTAIHLEDPKSWPARPILYGGSTVNQVIDQLADTLPLSIAPGKLSIGGKEFTGPGYQLIAVIPEQVEHPELVLYAGTGTPGVAEINAIPHGPDAIVIADAFGTLHTGAWVYDQAGHLSAKLSEPWRRIAWRELKAEGGISIFFVADLEPRADEATITANCERGVGIARKKLGLDNSHPVSIYVYPDARSKESLTHNAGHGHAAPEFHAVHIVGNPGDGLVHLVAHEATHVLAYAAFEQAGSALLGEGLAVWVSGQYAGTKIDRFAKELGAPLVINEILGPKFRRLPEREGYMHAGLVVKTAVEKVGIEEVGRLLLGSDRDTWESACEQAGSSMTEMQTAYEAQFGHSK